MYPITSRFGTVESLGKLGHRHYPHNGIDFAMSEGTPLRSIRDGVIEKVTHYQGKVNIGNGVFVKWDDGRTAIYGHMSKTTVNVGDKIHAGDLIGYSGNSGFSTGAHLHFAIKEGNRFIDPSPYISDIQNMNVHIAQHIVDKLPDVVPVKVNFFDFMHQHMNVISDLKMQLAHLPYDTLFIQIGNQLLQFISIHASFINDIVACII